MRLCDCSEFRRKKSPEFFFPKKKEVFVKNSSFNFHKQVLGYFELQLVLCKMQTVT